MDGEGATGEEPPPDKDQPSGTGGAPGGGGSEPAGDAGSGKPDAVPAGTGAGSGLGGGEVPIAPAVDVSNITLPQGSVEAFLSFAMGAVPCYTYTPGSETNWTVDTSNGPWSELLADLLPPARSPRHNDAGSDLRPAAVVACVRACPSRLCQS